MDVKVDHYHVLDLPSGVQGSKFPEQEINKAYRSKARELHPDKRPHDTNAHVNFLKLQTSYSVLKDPKARKLFKGQDSSQASNDVSDLEQRERSARQHEERIARQLKSEIERIRAMHGKKMSARVVFTAKENETDILPKPSNLEYQVLRIL